MSSKNLQNSQRELISAEAAGTIALVLSVVSIPGAILVGSVLRLLFPTSNYSTSLILESIYGIALLGGLLFTLFFSAYALYLSRYSEHPRRARVRAAIALIITFVS